ncbi:hypothetical protein [Chromobacterium amazonense]|uniref:Uncharacterized protein n=1 Tax=Chromobacterium amazonense TaxID=1382803 RepID=A0A1S1XEJ0_9NEIS|nr:hypothetical protein [Chromobacterium amazonense]MBM2884279.1 hypothetical protein [Chromobacterium amazonense]MDQ4541966.1 hypothetical protein [Chromobacterium amazonense]OHX18703.1 hypothetical protein BI343_07775 [Chromobacterium amazonense]PRP70554.1 hypothetical protein BUE93_12385 [Chromobacterium amazonense]
MRILLLLTTMLALGGCNWVNSVTGLTRDSDKAVGAACRQTGRSLEECYIRNPEADKASIYAGWREMNEYMAKNKLETMAPPPEKPVAASGAMAGAPAAAVNKPAALAGKSSDAGPHPLTSEEADQAAKNDPQVAAVLAAMQHPDSPAKPKQSNGKSEADQKRLLNIINELNKSDAKHPAN